ncbi:hypothetical protein ABTX81_30545 [Kitasatospora sp. NPDC097605]|uniref:hypothetical protein n=1 Tax=Kitasatospora sp. NPDC097605 TaxID=3157226 RepID=UPI003325F934
MSAAPAEYDPRRQAVQARRAEAVRLQLTAGWSPLDIGLHLHADPSLNTRGRAVAEGYGAKQYREGATPLTAGRLVQAVTRDINRALQKQATEYDTDVEALRRVRVAQYTAVLRAALKEAQIGEDTEPEEWETPEDRVRAADLRFKARDQVLRVLARLDVVQGTPRPTKTEVTGADGAPLIDIPSLDQLRDLIAANTAADQKEGEPADGQDEEAAP